jgi:Anthrone oxygenase
VDFEDVLRFINLVSSGVTAGILVVVLVAVAPAMLALPDEVALRYKQKFDPRVDSVNPPATALAFVTGALIMIVADDLPSAAVAFTIVGMAGMVGVAATSLGVNMRINRRMAEWPTASPPAEFREVMARWSASHATRTLSGVIGFAGYVIAVLAVIE